jgi:hypothetical protein
MFEHSNGLVSSISAVEVCRNDLSVDLDTGHDLLEGGGCLIIESLGLLFEISLRK